MKEDIFAPKPTKPLGAHSFQIVRSLGKGATGEVFLAFNKDDNRHVALKILENPDAFDELTFKRFRDEVSVLRRLRHPNLIEAYEIFDYNGCLAFTMEHVDGNDLGQVIKQRRLTTNEADAIILQILDALHELHANQILHRDVKLENILLSSNNVVKVGDLGLMKKIDATGVTKPGLIFGTAQYMAPEYVKKGIYDIRGEIYATGMVLLELLTGKRRLANVAENKMMETLIKSRFALPYEMIEQIPDGYKHIVEKALAYDPEDRYQNAVEMRYDIIKNRVQIHRDSTVIMGGENTGPLVEWGRAPKSARRGIWTLLTLFLCAAVVFTSFHSTSTRQRMTIQQGSYRGAIRLSPGKFDPMTVSVSSGEIKVLSKGLNCNGATINVGKKIVECGEARYHVEFDSSDGAHISGFLVKSGSANIYDFKVEKSSSGV